MVQRRSSHVPEPWPNRGHEPPRWQAHRAANTSSLAADISATRHVTRDTQYVPPSSTMHHPSVIEHVGDEAIVERAAGILVAKCEELLVVLLRIVDAPLQRHQLPRRYHRRLGNRTRHAASHAQALIAGLFGG